MKKLLMIACLALMASCSKGNDDAAIVTMAAEKIEAKVETAVVDASASKSQKQPKIINLEVVSNNDELKIKWNTIRSRISLWKKKGGVKGFSEIKRPKKGPYSLIFKIEDLSPDQTYKIRTKNPITDRYYPNTKGATEPDAKRVRILKVLNSDIGFKGNDVLISIDGNHINLRGKIAHIGVIEGGPVRITGGGRVFLRGYDIAIAFKKDEAEYIAQKAKINPTGYTYVWFKQTI